LHIRQWSGRTGRKITAFFEDVQARLEDIAKPAGADLARAKGLIKKAVADAKIGADAVLKQCKTPGPGLRQRSLRSARKCGPG